MEWFLTDEGLDAISAALVLAAAGFMFIGWLYSWSKKLDAQAVAEALDEEQPQPFTPDAASVKAMLAEYGLRKSLPQYAKLDAGISYADERDIEELRRGTSDNLRRYLP